VQAKCLGLNVSHRAAERSPPLRAIRGRPQRSSAKPARRTSTTTRFVPEFVTRTSVRLLPARITRAGTAVSATGARAAPAPAPAAAGAGAAASAAAATRATAPITAR
jgi:hypothetical protein